MSLPNTLSPATPAGTDSPALGDDQFRDLKQYIVDVIGVPNASAVTAAAFAITTGGLVTVSQSPFTVPTLMRGTASQILRIESQYSAIVFGINGSSVMMVQSDGLNLNAGQLIFPATQVASAGGNTLDDYEEGTWTPTLTFATAGDLSVVYGAQSGRYTKIGRIVTIHFRIETSTFTHTTASGNLRVTGIPFTAATVSERFVGPSIWGGITKANYTQVAPNIASNTAFIIFTASGSGQAASDVTASDVPTGGTVLLYGTILYNEV